LGLACNRRPRRSPNFAAAYGEQRQMRIVRRKSAPRTMKAAGNVIPWNEQAQSGRKQPGKRRIENEARFAKAVVGPLRPSRVQNSLLPLFGNIEPGSGVEFKIVTGGDAAPERRERRSGAKRRKKEGMPAHQPPEKGAATGLLTASTDELIQCKRIVTAKEAGREDGIDAG